MITIQESVANKISAYGPTVHETVVNNLAQTEIDRRVDIITKALVKQEQFEKEFKKINKNDLMTYVDSHPREAMSKQRFDDIKKAEGALNNITNLIEQALNDNSADAYNKLSEIVKKNDNVNKPEKQSTTEG